MSRLMRSGLMKLGGSPMTSRLEELQQEKKLVDAELTRCKNWLHLAEAQLTRPLNPTHLYCSDCYTWVSGNVLDQKPCPHDCDAKLVLGHTAHKSLKGWVATERSIMELYQERAKYLRRHIRKVKRKGG